MVALIEFAPPSSADFAVLSHELREHDRIEATAMLGASDADALEDMAKRSCRVTAVYLRGDLLLVMGLAARTYLADVGSPWMLATTLAETKEGRRALLRHGRAGWLDMVQGLSTAWNLVAVQNVRAIRWLRWLGCSIEEHNQHRINGVNFVVFKQEFSNVR